MMIWNDSGLRWSLTPWCMYRLVVSFPAILFRTSLGSVSAYHIDCHSNASARDRRSTTLVATARFLMSFIILRFKEGERCHNYWSSPADGRQWILLCEYRFGRDAMVISGDISWIHTEPYFVKKSFRDIMSAWFARRFVNLWLSSIIQTVSRSGD
jgi:hypothetical protein